MHLIILRNENNPVINNFWNVSFKAIRFNSIHINQHNFSLLFSTRKKKRKRKKITFR